MSDTMDLTLYTFKCLLNVDCLLRTCLKVWYAAFRVAERLCTLR
jgi:hypothetical protein